METPSQRELVEYMQKLSQLYYDVSHRRISDEEAMLRLDVLKVEQRRLEKSGLIPLDSPSDFKVTNKNSPRHELDFKCQCKLCVRKHTITMADRDFLRGMKISWGKTLTE